MDFLFHDRMSNFLKSAALSPPRRPGNGFDLLDVVVVDPYAKKPAKMIVPTDTNLTKHFTKEHLHHRHKSSKTYPSKQKRTSDETFQLSDELTAAIGVKGVNTSVRGKHSSAAHVNLVISNEKSNAVSGAVIPQLELLVEDSFASIIKNAARYNIKTNEHWYNYYSGSHTIYFIAVITKTNHGSLSIQESDRKGFATGLGAKVSGVFEALTDSKRSESSSHISSSEGIVGVQMLCFPFKKGSEEGTYEISDDPTTIRRLDERERKWLQTAYKRRNWTLLESKQEEQIFFSRSRRRLSELVEAIGNKVDDIKDHVKEHVDDIRDHVKEHDYSHLKSVGKVLAAVSVAVILLILLKDSISTAECSLIGGREVFLIQQALSEGLRDLVSFALSAVLLK